MTKTTFKAQAELNNNFAIKCSVRDHELILDEIDSDSGMNPIEATLSALGACQSVIAKLFAKKNGVELEKFRIELEGDIDITNLKTGKTIPKIEEIRTKIFVKTDSPEEKVKEFVSFIEDNCPIVDILKHSAQMIPEVIIEQE